MRFFHATTSPPRLSKSIDRIPSKGYPRLIRAKREEIPGGVQANSWIGKTKPHTWDGTTGHKAVPGAYNLEVHMWKRYKGRRLVEVLLQFGTKRSRSSISEGLENTGSHSVTASSSLAHRLQWFDLRSSCSALFSCQVRMTGNPQPIDVTQLPPVTAERGQELIIQGLRADGLVLIHDERLQRVRPTPIFQARPDPADTSEPVLAQAAFGRRRHLLACAQNVAVTLPASRSRQYLHCDQAVKFVGEALRRRARNCTFSSRNTTPSSATIPTSKWKRLERPSRSL